MNDLDAYRERLRPLREHATGALARSLVPRLREVLRELAGTDPGATLGGRAEAALALPDADPEAAERLRGAVSERAWLKEQLAALEERGRWIEEGVAKETAELERKLRWSYERLDAATWKIDFYAQREKRLPEEVRALRKKIDVLTGIEQRLMHERDTYRREASWLHGVVAAKKKEAEWRSESAEALAKERDWLQGRLRTARDGRDQVDREVRAMTELRDALRAEVEALQAEVLEARRRRGGDPDDRPGTDGSRA